MSELRRCPQCDAEIPANSPAGLCPRCLLLAAHDSQSGAAFEPDPTMLTPPAPASSFVPPTPAELAPLFPQLEILELLGKGGMGAVYKARQPGLDRLVAVKILPPEISHDPAFTERFQREARALAKLSHPHIVAVYDFGQTGSMCYIMMEFVDGANLRQAIRTGTLKSAEALAIVPQICEALQFAHDEGIVHRDIKPENILIDKRGRVKIADFGLVKLLASGGGESPDVSLTATHQVMGTLRYMAPEQMQGSREVDHRADIYSLGVVFYELLTGELPMGKFAPPSKKVQIDVRLDEVVLRTLEQDPEQRYQHASDVKTDMETIRTTVDPASLGSQKVQTSAKTERGILAVDSTNAATERRLVQTPADCLLLSAGIAGVTACGVFLWLVATANPEVTANIRLVRGNLFVLSTSLAVYSAFVVVAGWLMRHLRARLVVLSVCVIVGLFLPAVIALNVIMELRNIPVWPVAIPFWLGIPAAFWAAVTLFREEVRHAFDVTAEERTRRATFHKTANAVATPSVVIRRPAEAMMFVAGAAMLMALVPVLGLISGRQMKREALEAAGILAVYAVFVATAGRAMREVQARGYVLLSAFVAGIFLPASLAFNALTDQAAPWPAWIPMWLGIPVVVWVMRVLSREDVQAAFDDVKNRASRSTAISDEPRFSRFAIAGAVWALFGLLAVIPVLYFIGLNRVWNGEALPTDVIHSVPPVAFTIFMGALLVIGAGAPIGTTIYGAIAIGHIKRSGGKIIGLPLAVADAVFFPLLLLGSIVAFPCALASAALFPHPNAAAFAISVAFGMLGASIACFGAGRAAWRMIASGTRQVDL